MKSKRTLVFTLYMIVIAMTLALAPALGSDSNSPANQATASEKFDHSEYMKANPTGQRKAEPAVKGVLTFDTADKTVKFLLKSGDPAFSIKFDSIKTMLYEQAEKPRYTETVVISPMFLLAHSKKHFLTIQYTDDSGSGQFVIVHLDKKNAREAVAAAEAATGKKVERVEEK